jgi:hypothetical protein
MVNRCVNPACRTELRLLNSGNLYALERPLAGTDFFWLCSKCAATLVPFLDSMGIVSLRPREDSQPANPPDTTSTLRLVAHARRHMPWRHTVPAGVGPSFENRAWNRRPHGANR